MLKHTTTLTALVTSVIAIATRPAATAEFAIRDGDRIVLLGDSITEQRQYTTFIETYVLTRFPKWQFSFRNLGWGGDTAQGGLGRAERDLLPLKPTFVTIDFGMNDHGYRPFQDDIFNNYIDKQTRLTALLKEHGARVALLTPQPIEDRRPDPDQDARNQSLRRMSDGLRTVATSQQVLFADQFEPYMGVMLQARKSDPAALIGGGDSIHPGPVGHTIMAWAVLKCLGAPAAVSGAELDAKTGKVITATGCKIADLKITDGTITFTRADDALPAPVDPAAEKVTKLIPLLDELSRYELKVTGLSAPQYQLLIDGQPVAVMKSAELASGCNLTLTAGPITVQARQLRALVVEKNDLFFNRWRKVQLYTPPEWARTPDFEAARARELAKFDQQIAQLETRIETARQPKPHTFRLQPTDP